MKKTTFTIELVITDNRFTNKSLGSNVIRKTILKGSAMNENLALQEAENICGPLAKNMLDIYNYGRKYKTWVRTRTLTEQFNYSSILMVTFKQEL